MKSICLVVPTIRERCILDFIERWLAVGLFDHVDLMIIEDNPTKTFDIKDSVSSVDFARSLTHYSWEDIDRDLGENSWIIPRRSDTVRSFGYLKAFLAGYEYVMTLDDDCYPCTEADGLVYDGEGFVSRHMDNLNTQTRWFNTLRSGKPRGIPFVDLGLLDDVVVSHGLWTNVLDFDAPTQLAGKFDEKHAFDSRIVPRGQYFPMCGMNLAWKREVTVLFYHLLMGSSFRWYEDLNEQKKKFDIVKFPFDRFGDIFCGIILKKICDVKCLSVSTGMPYIRHERASNPFTNLKKEAPGLEVNEVFWRYIDEAPISSASNLIDCYRAMGRHIKEYNEFPEHKEYFILLGKAMLQWADLFKE